mmetsp:Transcript_45730/g.51167  ORF Transcript_45730/g.51167 Transcript_45730/m.51167 type:complete len:684 (-) Transcript_45730:491-2542(-)
MKANFLCFLLFIFLAIDNGFVRLVDCALVRLEKHCFKEGDTITVRFIGVEGEGVFIGLYEKAAVPDLTQLPEPDSESLKDWILTCGERENCADWPARGLVQLSTFGLAETDYIIAVSGDRSGVIPQSTTKTFHVGDCSSSSPFFSTPTLSPARPVTLGPTQPTKVPILVQTPSVTPVQNFNPLPTPVSDSSPESALVVSDAMISVIQEARNLIMDLIRADGDLVGKFIRLSFHDCIGGCNGCVDMGNPDNAGLDKPITSLDPVVNALSDRGLTRTDIWMLSALVATESALPPDDRDIVFPLQWIGRKTCEQLGDCGVDFGGNPTVCTPMRGPHVTQPHGTIGTSSIQQFFEDEFNFNPQQVTALMGAHSVGQMRRENSGFEGRWDLSSTTFDGGYWIELIGEPPDFVIEEVTNDDLSNVPNRRQWRGIVSADSRVTMLNADMALVRNLKDMENGIDCDFNGPNACSQDTPFMPFARRYNSDNRSFLSDFRDVLSLLINHGHSKAGDCPSGRVCTFGFESQGVIPLEDREPVPIPLEDQAPVPIPLEDLVPIPDQSPTTDSIPLLPNEVEGDARIFLDKNCYTIGETIVVNYENVSGENIWVGILLSSVVSEVQNLPASPDSRSDLLKEWTRSCGHTECHTWLPTGGLQFLTDHLEEEEYIIVVSGDGGSMVGQAATNFQVGRC